MESDTSRSRADSLLPTTRSRFDSLAPDLHDDEDFGDSEYSLSDNQSVSIQLMDAEAIDEENIAYAEQLTETSQWLSTLFSDIDVRKQADIVWKVRKTIWWSFWDWLFQRQEYCPPKESMTPRETQSIVLTSDDFIWEARHVNTAMEDAPPVLVGFAGSLCERHIENKVIAEKVTSESYESALKHFDERNPNYDKIQNLYHIVMNKLVGVDCFWKGQVEDDPTERDPHGMWYRKKRPNGSVSGWGTLRCAPFPFCCIFRYDDCDDYLVLTLAPVLNGVRRLPNDGFKELQAFVKVNMSDKIKAGRATRLKLRSMDGQDIKVLVGLDETKQKLVDAKLFMRYREIEDDDDVWENPKTGEVVSVLPGFDYYIETTPVEAKTNKCLGFVCGQPDVGVSSDFFVQEDEDGNAVDENGPQTLTLESMGIYNLDFPDDPGVVRIVDDNTDPVFFDYVKKLYQTYRDHRANEFHWKKRTLSFHFWSKVYEDDKLSKEGLQSTLIKYEDPSSPLVKDLFFQGKYSKQLNHLFHHLHDYDSSLVTTVWFAFWHCVILHNKARKYQLMSQQTEQVLNPYIPGSSTARVLPRKDLLRLLTSHGLRTDKGDGVIADSLINRLYKKMEAEKAKASRNMLSGWKKSAYDSDAEGSIASSGMASIMDDGAFDDSMSEFSGISALERPRRNNRNACAGLCDCTVS